ncbi:homeotic protein bicoid [Lucilia cuprina]|uniref:homeotic protein bicoid n=1 Tax=Lucilia cuprina TaxID=7375 RepID=UPI001F06A8D2|nr:homeotic protein bicoid [Lucilia cuprina]XP_023290977.2 homeotic protein bicoid [Lucilia cuprina]XP_046805500.1 homeotic protein bicoid [Lucilia cuprina]
MKMAQPPPDQNFYHPHPHPHAHPHPQLQLPPQFRNPFDLLFDERTGAINYNYIRPYIPNQLPKPDDLSDSLVMRRPRRTRTTFTSAQIAELEQHFLQGRYLTSSRLAELSAKLALGTAQVKIWFKNRRRRHKIQSDQQKDFSCDGMPLSPTVSNSVKSDSNGSASSCSSSGSSASSAGPPSLQSLSLNGSGGSTPNALTPSPTPTTPTANLMEHYGESAFNPYYYNNHHASHPPHHHHQAHHHTHASLTHPYAAAGTQYYPPPPPPGSLQHHQHQHQQQYHAPHPHQFQMQHKAQPTSIKDDPDYNFNNPYYMRMPTSLAGNAAATSVQPSSAMSPNSEVYEPLTPKNDENSSLCNGVGGGDAPEDLNETKTKLRVLVTNNANGNDDTCSNGNPIGSESSGTPINIMEDCTGAFAKFQKMSTDTSDPNYQCTMDTLMHAYNNHRNTSANTQQFATYCFN